MALRGGPLRSSSSAVSVPGWRVEDFFHFETDLLTVGVVQSVGSQLAVIQRAAGANMSVDVGTGLALIQFTTTLLSPNATLKSWLTNDAVVNVAVPTADLTNPRKDRIVATFDTSVDPNTAASNIVKIQLIVGTPGVSPLVPAEPSNSITLAIVSVAAGATSVITANIADSRPYCTLQSTVMKDVLRQGLLTNIADGSGTNTVTATFSPPLTALVDKMLVGVVPANDNTGAVTFNPSGLGAAAVKKYGSTALAGGDLKAGVLSLFQYNSSDSNWKLVSIPGNAPQVVTRYGTGVDGALNVTSGTTTLDFGGNSILVKNYTSINISVGATVNATNVPAGGGLLVLLSQGNVTIAGTLDLSGKGSTGGASVTATRTSNGSTKSNGNIATAPFNALGQTRVGTGSIATFTRSAGVGADSSGGCGGSNAFSAASSSAAAGDSAADTAGSALTTALVAAGSPNGILVGPGAGGDSGAVAINIISGYASGTFTATSATAGNGGGGLYIACGGNFSFTGTINLSGTNAGSSTFSNGTATNYGSSVGGSGGGAAGTGKADVAGTITNSGTVTANGGSAENGGNSNNGSGVAAKSVGTGGASGAFTVCQSY